MGLFGSRPRKAGRKGEDVRYLARARLTPRGPPRLSMTQLTLTNQPPSLFALIPAKDFGRLFLQGLVNRKEVLDLKKKVAGKPGKILYFLKARVHGGDGENFLVTAVFVLHIQHPYWTNRDDAAGKGRLICDDENIQRVAILG